ncbi:MAG: S-layer homology domain-containing protein [Clostridia bacterium]|nr:S-layer homology domain-containing protein [Clostridia bacterium]
MLKKICSVLLVLCMAFSTVGAFAYNDVEEGKETTAVELVTGLGIMSPDEDSEFGVKALVKRGEFALYVTKLMGYNVTVQATSKGYFDDVDTTTLEGAAVDYLAGVGAIPKSGNEYNPNDEITYVEAVRVLLNAMGYGRVAAINGGFPGGYLKTATECELNNNVWKLTNSVLTKADAATLLYNALFVHPMETNYKGEYAESDETLLEKTRDVYETIGIVAGYENTCLADGKSLAENCVDIGGEIYEAGTTNIGDYVGYTVYAYYNEARDGSRTLVAFAPKKNANDAVTLAVDEIEFNGERVEYYEGNTKKKLKFSESAAVIYNGGYYSEYESVEDLILDIPEGEVTFLSNDSTGVANVIIIKEYKHLLVERVDTRDGRLYLKNGSPNASDDILLSNVMTVASYDLEKTVYLDGKKIEFNEIQADDAVTMMKSLDGSKVILEVSRTTVEGSITSISDDEIGISGTKYPISAYCVNTYSAGTTGTFSITTDGKFLGLATGVKSSSSNYAYVLDVYCDNGPEEAYVELFTPDGEVKEYECASNIKINGQRVSYDEVPNKVLKSEIVTVKIKSDGTIAQLNRPFDASSKLNYVNETEFIKNWNKSSVRYTDGIMGMSFITEDTLIFSMPRFDKGNTSDYRILTVDDLTNRTYADVTCYDVDRQGRASVLLIIEDPADSVDMGSDLFFVKDISYTINDDDEDICRIEGYEGGELVTLDFTEDSQSVTYEDGWMNYVGNEDFDKGYLELNVGDAIQYSLDNDGNVAAYRLVFNNEQTIYSPDGELVYEDANNFFEDWSGTGSVTKQDFYDNLYIAYGDVQLRYMDYMVFLGLNERDRLSYESSTSPIRIIDYYRPINLLKASVYVYNVNNGELELGDMEDVMASDIVFVRSKKMGETNEIMVYVEE